MKWDSPGYQRAILAWLIERETDQKEKESYIFSKLGIEKTASSKGSLLRRAKKLERKWTISDICKIADYYKLRPADILSLIEVHYLQNKKSLDNPEYFKKLKENSL